MAKEELPEFIFGMHKMKQNGDIIICLHLCICLSSISAKICTPLAPCIEAENHSSIISCELHLSSYLYVIFSNNIFQIEYNVNNRA